MSTRRRRATSEQKKAKKIHFHLSRRWILFQNNLLVCSLHVIIGASACGELDDDDGKNEKVDVVVSLEGVRIEL
jgi:hypothetical protein